MSSLKNIVSAHELLKEGIPRRPAFKPVVIPQSVQGSNIPCRMSIRVHSKSSYCSSLYIRQIDQGCQSERDQKSLIFHSKGRALTYDMIDTQLLQKSFAGMPILLACFRKPLWLRKLPPFNKPGAAFKNTAIVRLEESLTFESSINLP